MRLPAGEPPTSTDDVTTHVLDLIRRHVPPDCAGGVHLDLAGGAGQLADPLSRQLGIDYVGIDTGATGLNSIAALGGHETSAVEPGQPDVVGALEKILDGRRLVSVGLGEGLTQLADPAPVLAAMAELLTVSGAVGVLAIPNAAHVEPAIRSVLGDLAHPATGPRGAPPRRLYSCATLENALRAAGLGRIDELNVEMTRTSPDLPADHVGLLPDTSINAWLRAVRDRTEPHALTAHFIWALAPVPLREEQVEPTPPPAPFLTVIMRSQGKREQEMREALLCLAGQSNTDFEVIVVGHHATRDGRITIETVVDDQPPRLRSRVRTLWLDRGTRSAPLNLGLAEARGTYIALLDDDDLVFANWVSSFADAARLQPGRVVRSNVLRQEVDSVLVRGLPGVMATGSPEAPFAPSFRLAEHLLANQSPAHAYAFPRSLVTHFGLRYHESMTTTEDWQFLMRAAQICGVTDIEDATAIYHWWPHRESSRTAHSHDEWLENRLAIERELDALPMLLPAGETGWIRTQLARLLETEALLIQRRRRIRAMQSRLDRQSKRIKQLEGALARAKADRTSNSALPRRVARKLKRRLNRTVR